MTALSTSARPAAGWLGYHPAEAMDTAREDERALLVLVVDDIGESRRQLCALVATVGHEALAAASGAAALELVDERRPDVVLLDLLMPHLDGFEVTRRIRSVGGDRWIPIIVTSSHQGDEHFIHALQLGADDFLGRPVNGALLDAKLRHYRRVLDLQARLGFLAERQRRIHDAIPDAVITLDRAGLVEEANLAARRMFGAGDDAELRGRACATVLGADIDVLCDDGQPWLQRFGGERFPAAVGHSAWTEHGRLHRTLVVRDLTEQWRIERMKDEFLATVSHELRTPLTSVLGALGLLAAGAAGPLPPAALPLAEAAQRNGRRLGRLIDDILDLTKLEADRLVLQAVTLAIGGLVREACAANQGYAEGVGTSIAVEIAPDAEAVEVQVDPSRFMQVMANLLSNAIKHSPEGATVTVGVQCIPAGVRVLVRDRGAGIDPAFLARMFQKFSQADGSDRRVHGGTGLGLYITRMLVERMGGSIGVAPADGGGTVFRVDLPAAGSAPRRSAPWVLVVDTDLDAQARVAATLATLADVETAASLAEAQERVQQRSGGAAPVVVADTRGQGDADAFCAGLHRVAAGRALILYSDSVDERYARGARATWLRKTGTDERALVRRVGEALAAARQEGE